MVSDAMLARGAEQILVDGAIDRRAASSPDVSDGLIMSTGAVLSQAIDEVVAKTKDAVDLVRLPKAAETESPMGTTAVTLPPRFALTSDEAQVAELLDANPTACRLIVAGALSDQFLQALLRAARRRDRKLTVVASNSTRVFLTDHGPGWYRNQGIEIEVARPITLRAITVNPVAPRSHSFDSVQLQTLLRDAIPDSPLLDVMHPDYRHRAPRGR
jgi:hypothetical protein